MKATIKKAVKAGLIVLVIFFIITEGCIYSYLKLYGYGIDELLGTTLVYFHLSQGFTVNSSDEHSVFIGRHNYIYDEMFEENGYYQADRMGEVGFYNKAVEGEEKKWVQPFDFNIISTSNWCHWFRVYELRGEYKIEDFEMNLNKEVWE